MKNRFIFFGMLFLGLHFYFFSIAQNASVQFPYSSAGLTKAQAAAHLLSRFTFGSTPGQVDVVAKMGIEQWFHQQLNNALDDRDIEEKLSAYPSLKMSNAEIAAAYPRPGQVLRKALSNDGKRMADSSNDKKDQKEAVKQYMRQHNLQPQAELLRELVAQKILRAAYANNQLAEVMTDFWFNHFNVTFSKGGVQPFVTSYERDVIRPHILGSFETLLLATAKSPAMLVYLDNNKSGVPQKGAEKGSSGTLNENYAREIMELHTLGVDGGFTQTDVTEAARVLTGWGVHPKLGYNLKPNKPDLNRMRRAGFVVEENFVFSANKHEKGEKKVLGKTFQSENGYDEGVQLIQLLAAHKATAYFISKKLAIRFVSDNPPQSLVQKMTDTFLRTKGDIKQVLLTMVSAPEFWSKEALRQKTKSPFEVVISSVRATGAQIKAPYSLYQWITKMGQKIYNYQAPTGFPDKGEYWINAGSLLNRMNFGLELAANNIRGVNVQLLALNNNHEPESARAALQVYGAVLLPERDVEETIKRVMPLLSDPELEDKVMSAADQTATAKKAKAEGQQMIEEEQGAKKDTEKGVRKAQNHEQKGDEKALLAQVVGVLLGSPEFQRR